MINLCHRLLSLHELNGKLPWKSNLEYQIPPVDLKDALLQWVSIEQHTNRCIWTRNLFLFLFHLLLKPGTYITHNTTYNTTQPPTVETCSLQPQPTLTQVTSLEAIYKTTLSGVVESPSPLLVSFILQSFCPLLFVSEFDKDLMVHSGELWNLYSNGNEMGKFRPASVTTVLLFLYNVFKN